MHNEGSSNQKHQDTSSTMTNTDVGCQIKWMFATPVLGFTHPKAATLNHQLWQDACRLRQEQTGVKRSNINGWHSEINLFERQEESFLSLKDWILKCSEKACKSVNNNFLDRQPLVRLEAWININNQGALNTPHSHIGNHWSGVYYAKVPQTETRSRSGQIEFIDPRGHAISASALPNTECFCNKFAVQPSSGMLLIFPSYLVHWVYPNESPEERMSIAFNITYKPRPKERRDSVTTFSP